MSLRLFNDSFCREVPSYRRFDLGVDLALNFDLDFDLSCGLGCDFDLALAAIWILVLDSVSNSGLDFALELVRAVELVRALTFGAVFVFIFSHSWSETAVEIKQNPN